MAGQGAKQPEPPPVVPSRFSTDNMSFTGLFKTVPEEAEAAPAGGAAFFTQLYAR